MHDEGSQGGTERRLEVAIWRAEDDRRVAEVVEILEQAGLGARALDLMGETPPTIVMLLPGSGGPALATAAARIAERWPSSPAVVLHTPESEGAHPAIEDHVFELLPASMETERIPAHVRAVVARWKRFEELKQSATALQRLESVTDLVYFDFRPDTGTFALSRQMRRLIGQPATEHGLEPSALLDRIHTDDRALFAGTLFEAARSGTPFSVQIRLADTNDHLRHYRVRGRAFEALHEGTSPRVFGVCEDLTEQIQRIAEAEARSRVDDLTGLGNRRHFDDCLAVALARARRERERLALLYVDLDRFKLINDTLGHDAGDQLLRIISARLSDAVRAEDVVCHDHQGHPTSEADVARLGGDEFTVLLSGIHGRGDAELVAARMLAAVREPVEIEGQMLTPSASIGIAMHPDDGSSADDLRKRADAALYAAKGAGGGFRFFAQSMEDGAIRRLSLEHELRTALARDQLELHYQPRVDVQSGRIVGAEALVRWSSPTLGRVAPEEIFRIAEETGFLPDLGRWVLVRACEEAAAWAGLRQEPCRLSVNVLPAHFDQGDVFGAVVDALKATGFPPALLDLEITENVLLRDDPAIDSAIEELRRMGVRIVLDDFGKGYSALAVLMSQLIDVLKLDRKLIETIAPDGGGSQLLANVIRMAHDLALHPIAEGVSHADQAEFLASQGCHEMQGFYFAAALPARTFRRELGIE
ncbi:MAG: EAL domain-containing protein [Myxococcota bacterium]